MEKLETNEKIAKCVRKAFQKLGENIDKTIFYFLKRDFNLDALEIAEKPEIFEKAIFSLFGELGAKIVLRLVLTEIGQTFNLRQAPNLTLEEAIAIAKIQCHQNIQECEK